MQRTVKSQKKPRKLLSRRKRDSCSVLHKDMVPHAAAHLRKSSNLCKPKPRVSTPDREATVSATSTLLWTSWKVCEDKNFQIQMLGIQHYF